MKNFKFWTKVYLQIYGGRFFAWWFGGINRQLERFHLYWHPTPPTRYRCAMCEMLELYDEK